MEETIQASSIEFKGCGWSYAPEFCSRLESVKLGTLHGSNEMHTYTANSFGKLLRLMDRVVDISLHCGDFAEDRYTCFPELIIDPFSVMAPSIMSTRLAKLQLDQVTAQESDLLDLLDRHSTTLKSLSLENCALKKGGRWSRLLAWIVENSSLTELEVDCMTIETAAGEMFNEPEVTEISTDVIVGAGEDNVKEMLRRAVSMLEATGH